MLNATLTVRDSNPNSHAKSGWMNFTATILDILNHNNEPIVFMLWGGFAQKLGKNLSEKHFTLCSAHPSPMAGASFAGCNCFAECNKILQDNGFQQIDWSISN
jgi:uracil-DNA glycosylase